MKVLHVNAGNLFGGVETYLVCLAESRNLAPDMHPEFSVCFPGRVANELRATGVPVHELGAVRWSRPWTVWLARRRMQALLKEQQYDLVIAHQPWNQALFGPVASRLGVPLVFYFHNPYDGDRFSRWAASQKPRLLMAPSADTLASFRDCYPGAARQAVFYPLSQRMVAAAENAVRAREEIRRNLGATPEDVVILQASRVEAWKGPDQVIQALAACRELPGWQFWFAGGPQRASEKALFATMQSLAQTTGIQDRVKFLGQRSDVPALMSAADLYTQGNRGPEGFGLSFLEASYRGIPSVTPRLGAVSEWMDESMSVLTPPEDVSALSSALRGLIVDSNRRRAMGEAARKHAMRICDTAQQLNAVRAAFASALA